MELTSPGFVSSPPGLPEELLREKLLPELAKEFDHWCEQHRFPTDLGIVHIDRFLVADDHPGVLLEGRQLEYMFDGTVRFSAAGGTHSFLAAGTLHYYRAAGMDSFRYFYQMKLEVETPK